jgi:hypothetical protein
MPPSSIPGTSIPFPTLPSFSIPSDFPTAQELADQIIQDAQNIFDEIQGIILEHF